MRMRAALDENWKEARAEEEERGISEEEENEEGLEAEEVSLQMMEGEGGKGVDDLERELKAGLGVM